MSGSLTRAVVIGGAGFLGSHVADVLTETGARVTVVDLKPSAYLRADQEMVVADMTDSRVMHEIVDGADAVYSFAGLADIDECKFRPVETVQTNILGTAVLLEACANRGVARFVFASTVYVYSTAGNFYRASKQACELYIEEYQRQRGLNFTILRYGTLYGRRADVRNSVYKYLRGALKDRHIVYPGDGDEIREYIHVADAARLSVGILDPAYANQHVVLTGHHPMRVADLMTMIREMVGSDVEISYEGAGAGATDHYKVTPYSYHPRIARKLVSPHYLDMGQGLLDCLNDVADRGSDVA